MSNTMTAKPSITKAVYLDALDTLTRTFESIPNTPMAMYLKALHLIALNMRYEKIAFDRNLKEHPFVLTRKLIEEGLASFNAFREILFIEDPKIKSSEKRKASAMEQKHEDLFNILWNTYDANAYEEYVDRYKHRIKVNNLVSLIKDKRCVDLGCGNGNFCFALEDLGAAIAAGVDFGTDSISYADKIR
jgi:hypothetical protein